MFFKWVLIAAVSVTVLSLAVCVSLAASGAESDRAKSLFDTCETTWQMGFGAILGVMGALAVVGRAATTPGEA
jgi:hypothetical protein